MSGRLFRVEHVESNDEGGQQTTTLLGLPGEKLLNVPRVQPFGFHSNVPKGSHGMGLQFGGGPDGGRMLTAVLGLEHKDHRPTKREVGSTALYDANGNMISLVKKELRMVGKDVTVIEGANKTTVLAGGMKIIVTPGKIELGGEGGSPVMTQAGPSSKVYAVT